MEQYFKLMTHDHHTTMAGLYRGRAGGGGDASRACRRNLVPIGQSMPLRSSMGSIMLPRFRTIRFRSLRAALGVVLAFHLGLAQASVTHIGMVHAPVSKSIAVTHEESAVRPCHEAAGVTTSETTQPVTPTQTGHHTRCCAVGHCQCASGFLAVVLSASPMRVVVGHGSAPQFVTPALLPRFSSRELRPPISV